MVSTCMAPWRAALLNALLLAALLDGGAARAEDGADAASALVERSNPAHDGRVATLLGQQSAATRDVVAGQLGSVQGRLQALRADDAACARSAPAPAPVASPPPDPGNRPQPLDAAAAQPRASRVSLPLATCERGAAATTWTAGTLDIGSRDAAPGGSGFGLHSQGVMFGADRRWGSDWSIGVGFGLAHRTAAAAEGVSNAADGAGAAAYLSWRPFKAAFVDAVLGHGQLQMRSSRRVGLSGERVASRAVSQNYGSLAAGYRLALGLADLAPYTRLEALRATLHGYSDGEAADALRFEAQSLPSLKAAVGLEGSSRLSTRFGHFSPRGRLEWRHELERTGSATLAYADDPQAPAAVFEATGAARDSLSLGLGARLDMRDNWSFDAGYTWEGSGDSRIGRVELRLSWRAL
jgi:outer membrane autotransporter protein